MKILKKILIIIAIIIAIPLIIALFVKNQYTVVRQITIGKPKTEVYNYLRYLKNQDNFSKWAKMDPNMKKEYSGTDGTVGFVSSWDSEKIGKGEQEIKTLKEGERIDYELRFIKPVASVSPAYITTEDDSNDTKVTWGLQGNMPYPFNILLLFMDMENMVGNDIQAGLTDLKTILEKQ